MSKSIYLPTAHESTFVDVRWSASRKGFIAKVVTESRGLDKAKYPKFPVLAEVGFEGAPVTSIQALAKALGKHLHRVGISAQDIARLRAARPQKESADG